MEGTMEFILYADRMNASADRAKQLLQVLFPREKIWMYCNLPAFSRRLRQSLTDPVIAILFASDKKELLSFLSIHDLLTFIPVILILPDRDEETIAKGHYLRPRFIGYPDNDLAEDTLVLKNMVRRFYQSSDFNQEEVTHNERSDEEDERI
jgi:hypothetical protein